MGIYENQILPRLVHRVLDSGEFHRLRQRTVQGLQGRVLELGFGSGPNLPFLPAQVDVLLAVDPAKLGQDLAAERLAASEVAVEFVGLDGACLPVDDASIDAVLSTWTLCTIPDVDAALNEVARVLKPGGRLHFVEHGLASETALQRWQHRIEDFGWKRLAGGCHLTRDISALIEKSPLHLDYVERFYMRGPRFAGAMYLGHASVPSVQ